MSKKGEVLLSLFAGVIVILAISGAVLTISKGEKVYVGDISTKTFQEYGKCSERLNLIPEEQRVVFESINQAAKSGFKPIEGCI